MFRHLTAWAVLVVSAGMASAQTGPHLFTVFPPGAKAGETVEVTLTGTGFDGADTLLFSDPQVKAELVPGSVVIDPKPRQPQPGTVMVGQLSTAKFKVTVPDGPPGMLDVRIVTKSGLSNPRAFVVGELAEVNEKEPNNDAPEAQKVDLDTTVNGVISTPTDVDYMKVQAKAGQNVVVYCLTTSIDSRMQAELMVIGPDGKPLVSNHGYRGGDAVLDFLPAVDGEYLIRVSQFAYTTGGPDHFYRLTVTTEQWVDAIYPPVKYAKKSTLYARTWHSVKTDPRFTRPDGRPLEVITHEFGSFPVPRDGGVLRTNRVIAPSAAAIDAAEWETPLHGANLLLFPQQTTVVDNEDNDTPEKAQPVTLPCDIAGRIEKKGDRDWYVFEAKKGEVWTLEVFADRIGSPVDAFFILTDEKGKVIVEQDDGPDTLSPHQFYTKSDDPGRYRFVVPADGKYRVMVSTREAATQFGVRDQYVLRIAAEKPDFRLAVMATAANLPDAGTLPKNATALFNVYVFRFDGFDGRITLSAENLPPGVSCPLQTIGSGQTRGTLVLTATPDAEDWAGFVTIKGTAEKLSHPARPFSVVWPVPGLALNQPPQNIPMITRMDRGPGLALAVRGEAPFRLIAKSADPIKVKPGEKAEVTLKIERKDAFKDPIQVFSATPNFGPRQQGNNPPQPLGTADASKDELKLSLDVAPNTPPGTYSVVLTGRPGTPPPKGPQARPAPSYPAMPVTVIVEGKSR
ncbi:MAG TPA: PPC domain-containing protein [Gemmataceae bacterium]|nr:PPC domain-containing protein [Gemmataceae bacterium]